MRVSHHHRGSTDENSDWRAWFERLGPRLLLCARHWTPTLADAEDAVQEGFIRFRRRQRFLEGSAEALLYTSVRRAALDIARRAGRRERRAEASGWGTDAVVQSFFEGGECSESVAAALTELPLEQREVLSLKIWGALTFREIGQALGVSANTAASRYRYALESLRQKLNSETRSCRIGPKRESGGIRRWLRSAAETLPEVFKQALRLE